MSEVCTLACEFCRPSEWLLSVPESRALAAIAFLLGEDWTSNLGLDSWGVEYSWGSELQPYFIYPGDIVSKELLFGGRDASDVVTIRLPSSPLAWMRGS